MICRASKLVFVTLIIARVAVTANADEQSVGGSTISTLDASLMPDVLDFIKHMDKSMKAMKVKLELMEAELNEQKELNEMLTTKLGQLEQHLSAEAPESHKGATKAFDNEDNVNSIKTHGKILQGNANNVWTIGRFFRDRWDKQDQRITRLEKKCFESVFEATTPRDETRLAAGDTNLANGTTKHGRRSSYGGGARERSTTGHVAFSAYLDETLSDAAPGHTIQMKGILLNDGNAYNRFTGVFTATRAGVYLFAFAVENFYGPTVKVDLFVDGTMQFGVVSSPYSSGYRQQGANVAILRLNLGQSVWLAIAESITSIHASPTTRYSTFSGVYLYA